MPESWNLASQMSIVIQLANIGPLVVTLMDLKCNRYLKLEPLVSQTVRYHRGDLYFSDLRPVSDWSNITATVMFLLGSSPKRKIYSILYFIFCFFRRRLYLIRNGYPTRPCFPGFRLRTAVISNVKFHLFHLCQGFKLVSFKVIFLVKDYQDLYQLLSDSFKVSVM